MPSFPRGHLLIYLPPSPVFRNGLSPRAFGDGRLLLYRYLGCGRERLYVPELRQKSVLVVVAAARHSPALFVEVGYFTERYGYAAMRWLERIERPIIGAFNGESGNDHVARVDVLGVRDAAVREGHRPRFGPLPKLVPVV